jgi:hypothetical protein
MKQAIAGVAPTDTEVEVMTIWPSISMYGLARFHGKLYEIKVGFGPIFTFGNAIALATIPAALGLYFFRAIFGPRYRLSNRRVVIQKSLSGADGAYVDLDRFDDIRVLVRPGQAWYKAGDLIFTLAGAETFRLSAVQRPEPFRQTCLKAMQGFVGVKKALGK